MTDCPEIERMAKESNASVLPEYQVGEDFAQNFTQSYLAAGWDSSDLIVLLEPTKPFRQSWLLRECVERYHASGGKIVTTGIQQSLTMITWNQATGRSTRATGLTILDACIVVAQCADFAKIQAMSDFWCDRDVEVVWHEAPTGVDFDYPCDLEYHLPTVGRFSDSRQS